MPLLLPSLDLQGTLLANREDTTRYDNGSGVEFKSQPRYYQ